MNNRELHLHLDGSLRANTVWQLIEEQKLNIDFPKEKLKTLLKVSPSCKSLTDFLRLFEIPLKVLQQPYAVERASYELIKDLNNLGMNYSEIRFAPQLSVLKGSTQEEILKAAISGVKQAEKEIGNFTAGIIVCMMRGAGNYDLNKETLRLTGKYIGDKVCALDVAGAESIYPTRDYVSLYKEANKMGLPITIHAGEAGTKEDLELAIETNTKRIGHGIRAALYDDLTEKIIDRGITLEMCVTSNVQTRVVNSFEEHPIRLLFDKGVKIALSSDNMTASDTNLIKEYEIIKSKLNFSDEEIAKIKQDTINAAFI